MKKRIFTIGYSIHNLDSFINIMKKYKITVIADVRSQPFSKYKPEFNRDTFHNNLKKNKISYIYLGEECGARSSNPECYINGKANYKLIANTEIFKNCINRIKKGISKYNICLMCAEKDPINCHRTILICRNLRSKNLKIKHLLFDGSVEDNKDTEKRLMKLNKIPEHDLFMTENDLIEKAYDIQGDKIAYSESENSHKYNNGVI